MTEELDEPIPLTGSVTVPSFPVDAFPEPIAEMVCAISEATQTDPAMAATAALSALSACTGGHAEIEVRPGWREPLCLYTATIAAPGERKSSVQRAMVRPILTAEKQLVAKGEQVPPVPPDRAPTLDPAAYPAHFAGEPMPRRGEGNRVGRGRHLATAL